mgnify:CR=1 FL=1
MSTNIIEFVIQWHLINVLFGIKAEVLFVSYFK